MKVTIMSNLDDLFDAFSDNENDIDDNSMGSGSGSGNKSQDVQTTETNEMETDDTVSNEALEAGKKKRKAILSQTANLLLSSQPNR